MSIRNNNITNMKTLKQEIKELASNQANLKQQRKTVKLPENFVRQVDPSTAAYSHLLNRTKLRIMYVALGLLRGRSIEQIESKSKTPVNMYAVNALKEKYEHEFKKSTEETNQAQGGADA